MTPNPPDARIDYGGFPVMVAETAMQVSAVRWVVIQLIAEEPGIFRVGPDRRGNVEEAIATYRERLVSVLNGGGVPWTVIWPTGTTLGSGPETDPDSRDQYVARVIRELRYGLRAARNPRGAGH